MHTEWRSGCASVPERDGCIPGGSLHLMHLPGKKLLRHAIISGLTLTQSTLHLPLYSLIRYGTLVYQKALVPCNLQNSRKSGYRCGHGKPPGLRSASLSVTLLVHEVTFGASACNPTIRVWSLKQIDRGLQASRLSSYCFPFVCFGGVAR